MPAQDLVEVQGYDHLINDSLAPFEARRKLRDQIVAALAAAGVNSFVVRDAIPQVSRLGLLDGDRDAALAALASGLEGPALRVGEVYPGLPAQSLDPLTRERIASVPARCPALLITRLYATHDRTLVFGRNIGTTIEFWVDDQDDDCLVHAPLENIAASTVHRDELEPAEILVEGSASRSIKLFARSFPGDVTFPIDALYTWVDGNDPAWLQRLGETKAAESGTTYHAESQSQNRYQNRDELRYSMRSLVMHAPWIRNIFLVTDGQVPDWLDTDSARVTVLHHRDVFSDPTVLPVFNSSAITTQLHHIDGLSEHYLYVNDDVFFGRDVAAHEFFYGNGIAKVFPSKQQRPFLPSRAGLQPHLNISTNIRALLEQSTGRSLSHSIRHTPLPQLRSVNYELEERFATELTATAARPFRHHADVALDQLFHYYAQVTGRAVPSQISYDYVNVGKGTALPRLRRLLAARDRSVFCLNDAPEPGDTPIPDDELARFLRSYFPFPADFEK